jgi:hypothetical protein
MKSRDFAVFAVVGAAAFAVTQYLLFIMLSDRGATIERGSGWFLNSAAGIGTVVAVLAITAAVATMVTSRFDLLRGAGAFVLGAVVTMAVTLFIIGPGNLFPIVIVFGAFCIAIATLGGMVAGAALRQRWY